MGYALIPKHKHTFTKAGFYKTLKDTEANSEAANSHLNII